MEFSELDTFAKVLKVNDKRFVCACLYHTLDLFISQGYNSFQLLFVLLVSVIFIQDSSEVTTCITVPRYKIFHVILIITAVHEQNFEVI